MPAGAAASDEAAEAAVLAAVLEAVPEQAANENAIAIASAKVSSFFILIVLLKFCFSFGVLSISAQKSNYNGTNLGFRGTILGFLVVFTIFVVIMRKECEQNYGTFHNDCISAEAESSYYLL